MTTAQVVETSVTVNNNSPIQDPDGQTQPFDYSYNWQIFGSEQPRPQGFSRPFFKGKALGTRLGSEISVLKSILFCLFIITLMRPVGPKGSDPGLRTLSAGLNACVFALKSSVTQYGVVVRQFCCLNYWHNFRSIRAMQVAYHATFASTICQSLLPRSTPSLPPLTRGY